MPDLVQFLWREMAEDNIDLAVRSLRRLDRATALLTGCLAWIDEADEDGFVLVNEIHKFLDGA